MTIETRVILQNEKGLHARPAGQIIHVMEKAKAELSIVYKGTVADASSIMDLLLLAAPYGAELQLTATGEDAEKVIKKITQLIHSKFGE